MAQTLTGTDEHGAGVETGLADATAAIIRGRKTCKDRQRMRLLVSVAATGAFRLNYLFTPDGGTSWMIGKSVTASTVTVDGGTALYVKSAQLDIHIGYDYKIEIFNIAGGSNDYAFEVREFT